MARLTITLSETRHRALKEAAVRRGMTIGEVVEESLELAGVKSHAEARELVARARERAAMAEGEALELATCETRRARRR